MAGRIQIPSSYTRLNNEPLDISLTFNTLTEARKYAAGIDNTKGTPYNGQIISVNSICGRNDICGTFKLESSESDPTIGKFRIILIEVKRLDTGEVITPENFIIYKESANSWLQVFKQTIKTNNGTFLSESAMTSINDLLLSNRNLSYSSICISDIFCNNNSMVSYRVIKTNSSTGESSLLVSGETGVLLNNYNENINNITTYGLLTNNTNNIYTLLAKLQSSSEYISYNGNNQSEFSDNSKGTIEVYINITDYLSRNGVK